MIGLEKLFWEMEPLNILQTTLHIAPRRLKLLFRANPHLHTFGLLLSRFFLSFLLSGIRIRDAAMPFGAALLAATGSGPMNLATLLGCLLGYWHVFPPMVCLEPIAACILISAAKQAFRHIPIRNRRRRMSILSVGLYGLIGLLYLIDSSFRPAALIRYAGKLLVCGISIPAFQAALKDRSTPASIFLISSILAALATFSPAIFPLHATAAAAWSVAGITSPYGLLCGIAAGLALDLTSNTALPLTTAFCICTLVCRLLPYGRPIGRSLCWLTGFAGIVLFFDGAGTDYLTAVIPGALAAPLLPRTFLPQALKPRELQAHSAARRLEAASDTLDTIYHILSDSPQPPQEPEAAQIFDRASEVVCRGCAQWTLCWKHDAVKTCSTMAAAIEPMLRRGQLCLEDFSPEFTARCRHLSSFLGCVNLELDNRRYRRQLHGRLLESRRIVQAQYAFLADYLAETALLLEDRAEPVIRYLPQLGVSNREKSGNTISGDRGASFRTRDGSYFVLLCDGMGTGPEAARESSQAIKILAGLLQAGQQPEMALHTLNGIYILRGDGGFSTVDLLQADLTTGLATLYKWGASPSYLKAGTVLKKIGTASPPPGLGIGAACRAERIELSLQKGEMLILLSDGAGGEETHRQLTLLEDLSPSAMADSILATARKDGEDDMTAAVLNLHPCLTP